MIDTIGFKVLVDRDTYKSSLDQATMTQRIDKKTGDIEFEYHNTKLDFCSPSWNYKVACKITDEYWDYDPIRKYPFKVSGIPNITFEYSVPKILFGHNLISTDPCLIYESMHRVKESFEICSEIKLPEPKDWYCYRIDTCANYKLENENQVKCSINYLQRLNYPRKIKSTYEDTGLYFPSRYNTLKIYWKGPEFKKHDFDRFKHKEQAMEHLLLAYRILRIEVEHRKRLQYIIENHEKKNGLMLKKFESLVRMEDLIEIFNFEEEMKRVMSKMLCGTETKLMKTIDALTLLQTKYSERQARSFHHTYMLIVTQGQKEAKKRIPEGTYYRSVKALRESGISLLASNTDETDFFIDKGFPADFSLDMNEENKYYQMPVKEVSYFSTADAEEPS